MVFSRAHITHTLSRKRRRLSRRHRIMRDQFVVLATPHTKNPFYTHFCYIVFCGGWVVFAVVQQQSRDGTCVLYVIHRASYNAHANKQSNSWCSFGDVIESFLPGTYTIERATAKWSLPSMIFTLANSKEKKMCESVTKYKHNFYVYIFYCGI